MWIKNVRLEKSFKENNGVIIGTDTEIVDLQVEDGKISAIEAPQSREGEYIDACEYLAVPSFRDCHIHLDKGHYGGPWVPVIPASGVAERIVEEEGYLKDFLPDTDWKAQALIDLICNLGVTHMRVQVNVDPVIGLENFNIIKSVLDKNSDKLSYELVAFPQHGTLKTQEKGYLEESLKEGIGILGGLDPASIDKDIEGSLKVSFDLAKKYDVKLDFHLHSIQTLGIYEIERILSYVDEYNMEGRVAISHGISLGDLNYEEAVEMAKEFSKRGISINTTQPVDYQALSFMTFIDNGVEVNIVNDNINDHWTPFGTGDLVGRVARSCEIHGFKDEYSISRSLKSITGGLVPLDDEGSRIWPKVGDKADIVFAKAESSAHLIARIVLERVTMYKGKVVSGEFNK